MLCFFCIYMFYCLFFCFTPPAVLEFLEVPMDTLSIRSPDVELLIVALEHPLLTVDEIKKAFPLFQRERIPIVGITEAA